MYKNRISIFIGLSLILALTNSTINCQNNEIKKILTQKPLLTALVIYTAIWAINDLDDYLEKHPKKFACWLVYLIYKGMISEDDASKIAFIFIPKHGFLELV